MRETETNKITAKHHVCTAHIFPTDGKINKWIKRRRRRNRRRRRRKRRRRG
jgi:hypothetical protein